MGALSGDPLMGDLEQGVRFNVLIHHETLSSRYPDNGLLLTLGLLEDINWMCQQVGWVHFLAYRYLVYIIQPRAHHLHNINN